MPTKTIEAEIDGKHRMITADIPDGSTPEQIQTAVSEYVKANPIKDTPPGFWSRMGSNATEVAKGAGKQALELGRNFRDISTFGAASALQPKAERKAEEEFLKSKNKFQGWGKTGAEVAEMMIPVPGLKGMKLAEEAPAIAKFGLEVGKGALEFGAKTFLQTKSPKAAAIGAVVGGGSALIAPLSKPVLHYAANLLGFPTGVGGEALRTAAMENKGVPLFAKTVSMKLRDAMRSRTTELEVAEDALNAVKKVQKMRSDAYVARLAALPKKGNLVPDLSGLQKEVASTLRSYRIGITRDYKTGQVLLDFSNSVINKGPDQDKLVELVSDIVRWHEKPGNLTLPGLDTLKRRIDNLYPKVADSDIRQIVQSSKDYVRTLLNLKVPGYQEMTKEYAEATKFIDDVTRELSLKPGANPGTAIRKFSNALNKGDQYRRLMIEALDATAGSELKQSIAGSALSPAMPRGIVGRGMLGGDILAVASHHLSPGYILMTALSSPRVVGELMSAISVMSRVPFLPTAIPRVAKGVAIEAGRSVTGQ